MRLARWTLASWMVAQFLVTTAAVAANTPPQVEAIPVIRLYPGYPISIVIPASDDDDDELSFTSDSLPENSTLDPIEGVFDWTPHESQIGAYVIPVTVTDDGDPQESVQSEIAIKLIPLDVCTIANCNLATGCENDLLPLSQSCCLQPPEIRVPDPEAACGSGTAVHIGRNFTGFGRLQNCDEFPVIPMQDTVEIRWHIEARCLDTSSSLVVDWKLETHYLDTSGPEPVERNLILRESIQDIQLDDRGDGWAHELALFRRIEIPETLSDLEGAEALFTITATDQNELTATERVRLVLTLSGSDYEPPDPGDDTIPPPSEEEACEGCHQPLTGGPEGERAGLEEIHNFKYVACVECHGGTAGAITKETAHVPLGDSPAFIKNLTSDELDAVDLAYLRFVNPGDLRVADQSCGLAGCHPEHVANTKLSVMSTYAGHYTLPRYLVGMQDRTATHAAVDVADEDFDPETAPEGAIESFVALREADPAHDRSLMSSAMDTYLPKACPTCHLNSFGENEASGAYRSSGCTACHMVYADDGRSQSEDPVLDNNFPPHPKKHLITTAIPAEQCAHCHFQGGRIGLAYRGIREGGLPPEQTPPHGTTIDESLYGHGPGFYFTDEDSTNAVDETPPDLHWEAGLVCMDCHVGGDVHGDGNLYSSERYQTGIRCEDCHGTVRAAIVENPDSGWFENSKGDPLKRLEREGQTIWLRLAMDLNAQLVVPQVHDLLEVGDKPKMIEAMGVDNNGYSHTDSLECYACHTSWRQTCFGCHITVDDSTTAINHTTGLETKGLVSAYLDDYSLDFFVLGVNERGKITPLCSSMSILLSYADEAGELQYEDRVRTSHDGKKGFGWNPFQHHTVSRVSQPCTRCHPAEPGEPDNSAILDATYGFGTGQFMVMDGDSVAHDLSQLLDSDGNLIADFPHPNTGPVPKEIRDRALAVPEPASLLQGTWVICALTALVMARRHRTRGRSERAC